MKYIILDGIRYYVTLRAKGDFDCNKCGRPAMAALSTNQTGSFSSLICSKCGYDCGGSKDEQFANYLKRQKITLKKFFSKIDYKLTFEDRKIVKVKRRK